MRRLLVIVAALLASSPAAAQISNVTTLPSDLVRTADLTAAQLPPCPTPAPDTLGGSAGTASTCAPRRDAARPTNVMPAQATTASDGTFSGTWPGTFDSTPATATAAVKSASFPYICQVATLTTTAYSGKCWQIISNTLPGVVTSLPGLVVSAYAAPAAGLTVMVVGRQ